MHDVVVFAMLPPSLHLEVAAMMFDGNDYQKQLLATIGQLAALSSDTVSDDPAIRES